MKSKKQTGLSIAVYLRWPLLLSVFVVVSNLIVAAVPQHAAVLIFVFSVITVVICLWLYFYSKKGIFAGLISFTQGYETIQKKLIREMSTPAALCDEQGYIIWQNFAFMDMLQEENASSGNIKAIFPDITDEMLNYESDSAFVHSSFGEKRYKIELQKTAIAEDKNAALSLDEAHKKVVALYITDETELVEYKKLYNDSKLCEGLIYLDNYDEALETVEEVRRSLLTALVDRKISNYISSMNGLVKKLEKDKYFFLVMDKDMNRMLEDRFSVLEEVKTINIGNELSLTLSIGVGMGGKGYQANYNFSRIAIDLALGRGGDQAVVKSVDDIRYFGGKAQAVEKNTRVKARVKAHAFRELLDSKDKLIVMGHKMSDVDSFGAAIGFWRIATAFGKKAYIVSGNTNQSVKPMKMRFVENDDYPKDMFISGDKALELVDKNTIVVVVDVNRPSYTEEPRLLSVSNTIVVVDHHRKGSETIDNAVLSYVEPYASSASEMVAEIVQYIGDDIRLTSQEAEAMYSGMVVDTQSFTNQTGVRTFEAAAFLRRSGADIVRVRKMFRENYADYKAKADAVDKAEIYRNNFAISVCNPEGTESPTVVGAQAANSLLEVRGIKAAVVLTPYDGKIFISARSIDEVNVQVMMEKLGGGGHKAVAGAQLKDVSLDDAIAGVKEAIDIMMDEGEIE